MTATPMDQGREPQAVLRVTGLTVSYRGRRGQPAVHAVRDVSLAIDQAEILGLVGESGCGKSTLARALVGLEPSGGEIALNGSVLPARRTRAQARAIQMVFQDPYGSLNPRRTVGSALTELLRVHRLRAKDECADRAVELLELVGLPSRVATARPRALSGGQRQRVAIARALALEPSVLVADEPTSSLDVSVQAMILDLFADLRDRLNIAILLITHNLGVVSAISDRAAVMYGGEIIEHGATADVLRHPGADYTRRLVAAVPRIGKPADPTLTPDGRG
jgi:ABC-type glutathione transport system ATPase component